MKIYAGELPCSIRSGMIRGSKNSPPRLRRVADCVRLAAPQATGWQRIGDQIDAAMIFARSDFVNGL